MYNSLSTAAFVLLLAFACSFDGVHAFRRDSNHCGYGRRGMFSDLTGGAPSSSSASCWPENHSYNPTSKDVLAALMNDLHNIRLYFSSLRRQEPSNLTNVSAAINEQKRRRQQQQQQQQSMPYPSQGNPNERMDSPTQHAPAMDIVYSTPNFEIVEDEKSGTVSISVEIPGVRAEDLSIDVEDKTKLRIQGARKAIGSDSTQLRFNKVFEFDNAIYVEKIQVELKAGILHLVVPQQPRATRRVNIPIVESAPDEK